MTVSTDIYQEWVDGYATPIEALRVLCIELGEVESDLQPLQEQRERLRSQLSDVLARIDGQKYTLKGFGTLAIGGPTITKKYDTHLVDMLVNELTETGYEEIARKLARCKGKSMRAGGLRIEREKDKPTPR